MKKNIVKAKKVLKSFPHAFRGLHHAFWGGLNFRLMVYAAIAAIIVLGSKPIPSSYKIALVLASALLLIVELMNTAIEKAMDLLLPAELEEIKHIKDMMAGAALIASVCWLIVALYAFAA
ncbi:diacylglycerol kinase [Candidatus Azambacteria bacterium]|nr:diacylglycerol kinase [Candidatus Azambacteria bacterium]